MDNRMMRGASSKVAIMHTDLTGGRARRAPGTRVIDPEDVLVCSLELEVPKQAGRACARRAG